MCDKKNMSDEEAEGHLRDHWQDILEEEAN
jgi:hypothetical protein